MYYNKDFEDNHSTLMVCMNYANKNKLATYGEHTGYINFEITKEQFDNMFVSYSKLYLYSNQYKPISFMDPVLLDGSQRSVRCLPWVISIIETDLQISSIRFMLYHKFVYSDELMYGEDSVFTIDENLDKALVKKRKLRSKYY